MLKTQTDTELIQRIIAGEPRAQEMLYEKYTKSVKNYLKNKYSAYYDLDDDVSEIMIKVFTKLETYDKTKSKFRSWVYTIANNHVIDKWRGSCVVTLNAESLNFSTSADTNSISSSNGYLTSNNTELKQQQTFTSCNTDFENCSTINFVSDQLTPQDYTLLDMKYMQGYNYCEIGSEFNVTSSTISNRVNYIKTKLKKNNPEIIYE